MKTITTIFLVATLFTFALAAAPAKKADKHVGLPGKLSLWFSF
jgi:hypothetical protein